MASLGSSGLRRFGPLAILFLIVLSLLYLYLFRTKIMTIAPGQVGRVRWQWGSPKIVELDINHDGLVDYKAKFQGWSRYRSAEDVFVSAVAASRCNGDFDVEIFYHETGAESAIRFDTNRDGQPEVYTPAQGFAKMAETCDEWREWIPRR